MLVFPILRAGRIFPAASLIGSRQVGGTGLGISIVKHAMEQMNGAVAVESHLGTGSTFMLTLPRYPRQ
ncbi:MAG: hypothetical protein LAQ69_09945 [Acidobacteriia bacterium]|nr:hypothetical protein [Terriglobia bacterium]